MPKETNIPLQLVKSAGVALTSRFIRIGPLRDGETYLRWTSIDKDEVWDSVNSLEADALGPQRYLAATGLQMSTIEATNDLSVDNAEAQTLMPVFPMPGITQDMVERGDLDSVEYCVWEHAVGSPDDKAEVMASGIIGKVRIEQGLVAFPELVSWSQLLDQTGIISQTSLDCRAKQFGSQPGEEREWCGYDLTYEWVPFTVSAVGEESVREFYSADLTQDDGFFDYGKVLWTSGDNDGRTLELESFSGASSSGDAYVSLRFTTRKPIQVDDQGEIQRGCSRKWSGHNSCQTYFGTERGAHFRGEPLINIGDSKTNSTPGVNVTNSTGSTGEPFVPTVPAVDATTGTGTGTSPATRTRGATIVTVDSSLGDGVTDATAAIQAAIDSLPVDGGTVTIPPGDSGPYMINSVTSIRPCSYMLLELQPGCELKAKDNTVDRDYVVLIQLVTQVEVAGGGTIHGDKDTFVPQAGTTSEHGHGIAIYGSTHITVRDIRSTKCVGDGSSVGAKSGTPCSDIVFDNVVFDFNRRQGLSLVDVDGCTVTDSEFSNTSGTSPECGIDIEPEAGQTCTNIVIDNCHLTKNHKYGINVLQRSDGGTVDGVIVRKCLIDYQDSNGAVTSGGTNVDFTDNTIELNSATGLLTTDTDNMDISGNTFQSNYTRNGITTRTAFDMTGTSSPTTDKDILVRGSGTGVVVGTNHFT